MAWQAAAIGAAGDVGGSLGTSALNARQAKKNRAWQKKMSDTAHQREVKDLELAGLNPILSAKYGGSSTPVGATARAEPLTQGLGKLPLEVQLANSAAALQKQQKRTALSQEKLNSALEAKTKADKLKSQEEAKTQKNVRKWYDRQSSKTSSENRHLMYDFNRSKSESKFYEKAGKYSPWIERAAKWFLK